uniref:Uncharacterized protein n=2 Tax=Anguilla anguilla TaxID=7936 RepID=A0A0E9PKI5_ANGAN
MSLHTQLDFNSSSFQKEETRNKMKWILKTKTEHLHTADTVPLGLPQVNMKMEYQKKQMEKGASPARASIALSVHQKKCVQGVLKEQ